MPLHRRRAVHQAAVAHVVAELGQRGLRWRYWSALHAGGLDLDVNGHAVAVRGACVQRRQTTVRARGKVYRYRHRQWLWNCHAHGQRRCQPDVWILVGFGDRGVVGVCLVVPNEVMGASVQNVCLQDTDRETAARSRLRACLGRWEVLAVPPAVLWAASQSGWDAVDRGGEGKAA